MAKRLKPSFLESKDQLPQIDQNLFKLYWDFDFYERATLIKLGDSVIWKEPVTNNGYERFHKVGGILKSKYGKRLIDLIPQERSFDELIGEPWQKISITRRLIRNHGLPGTLPGMPNPLYWLCDSCGLRVPRHPDDANKKFLSKPHENYRKQGEICEGVYKAKKFDSYGEWVELYIESL